MLELPAMLRKLDAARVDRVMLIPAMNDVLPHTPEALLALNRALLQSPLHGLARRIHERMMTATGDLLLRGKLVHIYGEPAMEPVAQAISAHPERFLGWIFLNPARMADPVAVLERWAAVPGFVGVKLHPHWHGWPMDAALPIAERCEALRLPILIHLGFREQGAWHVLTRRFPKLRVVFAHAGLPHFQRMWSELRRHAGLYLDVSSPYLSEGLVRRAVRAVGPQRVLYGTDAPYGFSSPDHSYDYAHIRAWVERLPIRAADVDDVLGGNVERLLADER